LDLRYLIQGSVIYVFDWFGWTYDT